VLNSRDITEEKLAARNLRMAEERWRFALEGAQQGVWDWNIATGDCYYSNSYKKLYGYSESDLNNRIEEWQNLIHPDDRRKMESAIHEHTSGDDSFHESTYRLKAKDGNYKWILARGMIVERDEKNKPLRMIGTHTDITESVTAREKLRVSEQHYRTLFQSNPLPCWIYEADSLQFQEVNQAAIQHYGYSREEFLRSTLYDLQIDSNLENFRERLQVESKSSTVAINNWIHKKKNGQQIFVDLRINSIQYKGVNARLVVAHDVTQRAETEKAMVETEEALRKSNERFELVSKASSDAIYDWNLLTGELYWGDGMQALFGYEPKEMNFEKWMSLIHPDDKEGVAQSLAASLARENKWQEKYRFMVLNGDYRYVLDRGSIIRNEKDQAIRMTGSIQDITDLRMKDAELEASNERYRYATLATSDIVWDWNFFNNQVLWSENFQKVLGWELPANKTLDFNVWLNRIHPLDKERVEHSLDQLLSDPGKTIWQEEYRYLRSDGTYCYLSDKGYLIRDGFQKPLRMIGAMQDITERNYYEQLLSLERQIFEMSAGLNVSFKEIAETLLKGIETLHPDSYTSVVLLKDDNTIECLVAPSLPPALTEVLNGLKIGPSAGSCGTAMYEKQTIISQDIEHDPLWQNYLDTAIPYGLKACWSLPIIHSSGKVMGSFAIYYKKVKSPTLTELDTVGRVRNIIRVLMEHYWSVEEIKVANERFDVMMKATHDLVWDWNLETNEVYRDEFGLRNVYGTASNEPIEKIYLWLDRIHADDRPRVEKVINNILQAREETTFDVEYRFRRDDGNYSFVFDRGMIIRNADGRPVRMIGAAQDVTVRKKLEQELLQNELERQKAINQATVDTQEQERSEIGKELHDNVNQVLTTTKLYLDLALSNKELKDQLIEKSNKNIISVINEIRQLSRSLMDPSIGDLGLIDSINDLVDNINLTRRLHVELKADRRIETYLNKNHKLTIFRIIQEALNNAIKHAKATKVEIAVSKIRVNSKKTAVVTITDNGIGFNPDQIKKGAGLKNIQNRIYLINGTHSVESAPGSGCTIHISFPLET
jgi:PAS domain S-box-containing protein